MYGRYPQDAPDEDAPRRSRLVTPARVLFMLLLLASSALVLYGFLFDRSGLQIPIMVSGLVMSGVALAVLALYSIRAIVVAGRRGSGGRAFGWALVGGIAALAASGALSGAVVLFLVVRSS